ncbi:MAG: hypothetical protein DI537_05515 [Stutzerimonas stutzeri]|nr:MAG: hypothetical protein DI537_05515 [Stutzerimonas stutzeri]
MTGANRPVTARRLNPITGVETSAVLFGYLDLTLGLVHAVNAQGRPDEGKVIGPYVKGSEPLERPMGRMRGEAVIIRGKPHPICAGQFHRDGPRENERKNGIVMIDASALETGPV